MTPISLYPHASNRMEKVATRLKATKQFQVALMRNPFDPQDALVLITRRDASKGLALDEILRKFGRGSLVVAAGDDENDVSLLKSADVKIAMSHAPDMLQEIADFIAPPTEKMGIILALEQACNGKRA